MQKYEFHEIAGWLPMMEEAELQKLALDIKEHGLLFPIVLYDGKIVDGRNRYKACEIAGVEAVYLALPSEVDPVIYAISTNLRRDLTVSQRAMYGDRCRAYYDAEAKKRQVRKPTDSVKETLPEQKGQARDRAGKAVGVSGKSIDKARRVREKGVPELAKAVEDGNISVSEAARIAESPLAEQEEIMVLPKQERVKRIRIKTSNGLQYAQMAINQLRKIDKSDEQRQEAFDMVEKWIRSHR